MDSIRYVKYEDVGRIAHILNYYIATSDAIFRTVPYTAGDVRGLIDEISGDFPFLVYEIDGVVAGFCYAHPWKARECYARTWEVTVYVSPDHCGRGIGSAMVGRLVDECRQTGRCHSLIACITASNTGSIEFHMRLGFEMVSHFTEVGYKNGHYLDVVDLQLML